MGRDIKIEEQAVHKFLQDFCVRFQAKPWDT